MITEWVTPYFLTQSLSRQQLTGETTDSPAAPYHTSMSSICINNITANFNKIMTAVF